jgi:hypothetical protein
MKSRVTTDSIVVVSKDQVSSDLAGEIAILNLKAGSYYGLDHVGARIWNLIQKPMRVSDVRDTILKEYEVEPDQCEHDLIELLEKLAAEGLIEVNDEADE